MTFEAKMDSKLEQMLSSGKREYSEGCDFHHGEGVESFNLGAMSEGKPADRFEDVYIQQVIKEDNSSTSPDSWATRSIQAHRQLTRSDTNKAPIVAMSKEMNTNKAPTVAMSKEMNTKLPLIKRFTPTEAKERRKMVAMLPISYFCHLDPSTPSMATSLLKLSVLFSLLSNFAPWSENPKSVAFFPPSCSSIECPSYDLIQAGNGYEIRRYNSTVWMSTSSIDDISIVEATRTGFLQLFNYIQGKNLYNETIEMTAPVLTQVSPSDGPFCKSSFVVSFYVPKENQANPPPAQGLHAQKWGPQYAAVRQFGGFVTDSNVGVQAATLHSSLAGSIWSAAIDKAQATDPTSIYTVAQYNSPFEFEDRVNEIWMMFDMEDDFAI
ncbi:hypothetical protein HHK36_003508 [Tetracentron sinense]|uniref:SOUL heme-binding protein n=1 Tax=Tetracentron sinense TaxID=13715 RepID=A0A834ZSN1_TETSI|nr:hypothetical protein HHK36_003508 [Tetracentron sinense]